MKQVTDNQDNINADINALVDRICADENKFFATYDVIELIRESDSYEVKDALIEYEYILNDSVASKTRALLNAFDRLLDLVFGELPDEIDNPDPYDVPFTEEEQARADYENAMLIQSKRDRKEYEASK